MRLFQEIFAGERGEETELTPCPRCVLLPERGGYFEGVRSVGDFSEEKIVLYFSRDKGAVIEGNSLTIEKYCDGDLRLSGKIQNLRFCNPDAPNTETDGKERGKKK